MTDSSSFDYIVSSIYNAASGRAEWRIALEAITDSLSLWGAQLIGLDKRSGTLMFSLEGGRHPPESTLDYLRHYHSLNPRVGPSLALAPGQWLHCHELFDDDYVANSPFYQEFLIPYGGRYLSGTKIIDNDDVLILLGAMRGNGSLPLNREEIAYLERVKHHLVEAMGIYLHLRQTYAEAGIGKQLLNEFRYPMMLVDANRSIWFRNKAADQILDAIEYVASAGDLLRCRDPEDDKKLLFAVRSLELESPPAAAHKPVDRAFIRIRKANSSRGVAVYVIAIRPAAVMGTFGHTPLALVLFHDPDVQSELDPFIVAETFGLTPAESKVAVRLARGADVDEISHDTGVSINTLRTQLKSIFGKTGTSRQAELTALLAAMPDIGLSAR
jgi:DNA-binding CsgD family transcriptional regulator